MNLCMNLCTKSKQKKKFVHKISKIGVQILKNEILARILNKERHLYASLNKPTKLHQDRHSKTSSFDNYLVSLSSKSIKIILKFLTYNCAC